VTTASVSYLQLHSKSFHLRSWQRIIGILFLLILIGFFVFLLHSRTEHKKKKSICFKRCCRCSFFIYLFSLEAPHAISIQLTLITFFLIISNNLGQRGHSEKMWSARERERESLRACTTIHVQTNTTWFPSVCRAAAHCVCVCVCVCLCVWSLNLDTTEE